VPPTIVPARPVASGPLAARWLWYDLPPLRAGATVHARAELENAGSATWEPEGDGHVSVSYHWLDPLGNPIVWGGIFSPVRERVLPGARTEAWFAVAAPMPPGRYRLSLDLVSEGRSWFSDLGNSPLVLYAEVAPRLVRRALAVRVSDGNQELLPRTLEALEAQEEPLVEDDEAEAFAHLVPGCLPAPDWSRRLLDAHSEGFAYVGGSVEPVGGLRARRKASAALAPWAPTGGRNPAFPHPLLCPSIVREHGASWEDVAGLPALRSPARPWIYDARLRLPVLVEALEL
jgi:hypothetical protein